MNKKDFELIIFDLDGTLYPKSEQITKAFKKGAAKMVSKIENVNQEEAVKLIEQKKKELGDQMDGKVTYTLTLLTQWQVNIKDYEKAVADSVNGIPANLNKDRLAIRAVSKVAANYSLYLYTTNNSILTERLLDYLDLKKYFLEDRWFTVSTIRDLDITQQEIADYIKPGLSGFEYIIKREKVDFKQVLIVGDSQTSDIKPAEKLRMKSYKVSSRPDLYNLPAWLGLEG